MTRAIIINRTGGPEVLELIEREVPEPQADQVRVKVAAAGVNFIDTYFRSGAYPARFPFGLGLEGAGVVELVGSDVEALAVGDKVAWAQVPGSYAESLLARPAQLVKLPAAVALDSAAAAMLQGMTAHYLVHSVRETHSGDTALVHAAAGGTGLLLTQMLKTAGVRVIGTCSTEDKAAIARQAGADEIILYTREDFAPRVRELTAGTGVDVVYDSVGQATFDSSLSCIRPRGMLVLFGQSSGAVPPLDLQRLNQGGSLFVTRPSLAHYTADPAERDARAADVLNSIAGGKLQVRIGARFPLEEAADAQRALEGRSTTGKVLLMAE